MYSFEVAPRGKVFNISVISIRLFDDKGHKKYQNEGGIPKALQK